MKARVTYRPRWRNAVRVNEQDSGIKNYIFWNSAAGVFRNLIRRPAEDIEPSSYDYSEPVYVAPEPVYVPPTYTEPAYVEPEPVYVAPEPYYIPPATPKPDMTPINPPSAPIVDPEPVPIPLPPSLDAQPSSGGTFSVGYHDETATITPEGEVIWNMNPQLDQALAGLSGMDLSGLANLGNVEIPQITMGDPSAYVVPQPEPEPIAPVVQTPSRIEGSREEPAYVVPVYQGQSEPVVTAPAYVEPAPVVASEPVIDPALQIDLSALEGLDLSGIANLGDVAIPQITMGDPSMYTEPEPVYTPPTYTEPSGYVTESPVYGELNHRIEGTREPVVEEQSVFQSTPVDQSLPESNVTQSDVYGELTHRIEGEREYIPEETTTGQSTPVNPITDFLDILDAAMGVLATPSQENVSNLQEQINEVSVSPEVPLSPANTWVDPLLSGSESGAGTQTDSYVEPSFFIDPALQTGGSETGGLDTPGSPSQPGSDTTVIIDGGVSGGGTIDPGDSWLNPSDGDGSFYIDPVLGPVGGGGASGQKAVQLPKTAAKNTDEDQMYLGGSIAAIGLILINIL